MAMASDSTRKRSVHDGPGGLSSEGKRIATAASGSLPDRVQDDPAALILAPPHSSATFAQLGARLRGGRLVAFPTETVYGLGANGLDASAVLKIFEAKGRPLSDPCILHVAAADDALQLLDLNAEERSVFRLLSDSFWPGPLSIVGKAQSKIPPEVTASTGFCAVRCPAHPVARQLIEAAGVPLAAPSANRFGHISPTLPEHVLEDLGHWEGLRIVDGGACNVGIESTVLKLDLENGRVVILRKGGVTKEEIETAFGKGLECGALSKVVKVEFSQKMKPEDHEKEDAKPQAAPGMMLKHYAPAVPTFLLKAAAPDAAKAEGGALEFEVGRSVLVDFGEQLKCVRPFFMRTFELCRYLPERESGDRSSVEEACARAFAILREAEVFALSQGATSICLADFDAVKLGGVAEALHDRLFRAASGNLVSLVPPSAGGQQQQELAQLVRRRE